MKTDESRITGDATDAVATKFAALKDLTLAGNLHEASNRDRGGKGVVYGFSIVDKPLVDVFYPRSLWAIEVGCSLCSCPKCSDCLYTENLLHYGLGSNLTDLRSPL